MSQDINCAGTGNFKKFNELWYGQLNQLLHKLKSAPNKPTTEEDHHQMMHLVNEVKSHYDDYYKAKSSAIERDVVGIFVSSWTSTIERCLHWIGGWRPTTIFHLVYTDCSVQFESQIRDIIGGLKTGNLGDLSPLQFSRMSDMQSETVKAENLLSAELSSWQEGASSLTRTCTDLNVMMSQLISILQRADTIRLETFTMMVELLTPQQAVEFMIATIELEFGVRGWGKKMDLKRRHV